MKYDAAKEKEKLNELYRNHALYPALSIVIYWLTASVDSYLSAADQLVFQKHAVATVANVRRLLKQALVIESADESMNLRGKIAKEEAKPWLWHSEFSLLWSEFSSLNSFMHGEWENLTLGVYATEGR